MNFRIKQQRSKLSKTDSNIQLIKQDQKKKQKQSVDYKEILIKRIQSN